MKKVIVLPSGGIAGWVFLFALKEIKKCIDISEVTTYAGCSVGSIISVLLCIISIEDIIEMFPREIGYIDIKTISYKKLLDLYGVNDTLDKVENILEKQIMKCFNVSNPTMKEFYEMTNKNLYLCSYNVERQEIVYFNHKSHGDVKLIDAVKASCCIPLLFYACKINGEYYIDGGVKERLPVNAIKNLFKKEEILCFDGYRISKNKNTSKHNIFLYGFKLIDSLIKSQLLTYDKEFDTIVCDLNEIIPFTLSKSWIEKNMENMEEIGINAVNTFLETYKIK